MARKVEGSTVRGLQRFLSKMLWNEEPLRRNDHHLRAEAMAASEGVLLFDKSGMVKKGWVKVRLRMLSGPLWPWHLLRRKFKHRCLDYAVRRALLPDNLLQAFYSFRGKQPFACFLTYARGNMLNNEYLTLLLQDIGDVLFDKCLVPHFIAHWRLSAPCYRPIVGGQARTA